MTKAQKLTVKVFNRHECPKNATCAAVDSTGDAHWFIEDPDGVVVTQHGIWDTAEDWTPIPGKFDASDWENSKIINPKYKGKKLTQDVFEEFNCPFDPVCAVVQPDGSAYYCATLDIEAAEADDGGWRLTQQAAKRYGDKYKYDDVWCPIEGSYDTTDWQHSMVLRPTDGSTVSSVSDPNPLWTSEIKVERPSEDEKQWEPVLDPPDEPIRGVPDSGLPDSGRRESFDTGAVRDDAGDKPRPDLISPFFLERLGEHMRKGAIKYSANNWAKGIPNSRCWASLQRHLMKFAQGLNDEDHLAAAAFNLMAIIHNEEVAKRGIELKNPVTELVDMPLYGSKH